MTPGELKALIQHMVDRTCEAHIRLVIDRLDNILKMSEAEGGLARARQLFGLYRHVYGEPLPAEPLINLAAKRNPLDRRCGPMSEEHKAKIRAAKAAKGLKERNRRIVEMITAGASRTEIAKQFNLTTPRITQIYNGMKGKGTDSSLSD